MNPLKAGLVPVESTKLEGMTDFIEVESGHSMMRYDKEVARQVIAFLQQGRFLHTADDRSDGAFSGFMLPKGNETSNWSIWRINESLLGVAVDSICLREDIISIYLFIYDK